MLLAAGLGRRFGGDKLMATVNQRPLYDLALTALPPRIFTQSVVVSQHVEILKFAQEKGFLPIVNPEPQRGISSSIHLGMGALDDTDGILFSVCDQPHLSQESVQALIALWRQYPNDVCALAYNSKRGNPVIFPRRCYPQLLALTGDRGGSAVIRCETKPVRLCELLDPKELQDVDTPQDL